MSAQPIAEDQPPGSPNRLSIGHLLLWTAASALALVAILPERPDPRLTFPEEVRRDLEWRDNGWRVMAVVLAPILGAGVAAIAIAAWRVVQRRPGFPTAPGHWLLMIVGAGALAVIYTRLVELLRDDFREVVAGERLSLWVVWLVPVAMLLVAASCVREPPRWKYAFILAIGNIILFFAALCGVVGTGSAALGVAVLAVYLATPLWIVVAGARDVQLGIRADVFHWLGVAAVPLLAVTLAVLLFFLRH